MRMTLSGLPGWCLSLALGLTAAAEGGIEAHVPGTGRVRFLTAIVGILAVVAPVRWAQGIIDPKFTPVEIVRQAQTILVGSLAGTAEGGEWTFKVAETLKGDKGNTGKAVRMDLGGLDKDQAAVVGKVFASNGEAPVILFASRDDREGVGYLHVEGTWLSLKGTAGANWAVTQLARKLSASFAGGTDMLIRMSRYILADEKATVPVSVGAAWMRDPCKLGKLDGTVSGMAAIGFKNDKQPYLFVGCDKGDRLFRAKADDEAFEDVTAGTKLRACSRQSAWIDLDGDGAPDLVSWDGGAITTWQRATDGGFKGVGKALEFRAGCLGLAACSSPSGGAPAVLVSTADLPVLLARTGEGWTATELPGGDAAARAGPARTACVVADLDNDGRWDVLQPREKGGLLWRGKAGGWAAPERCEVACSGGRGCFALGDFNQDGFLDIFLSDSKKNELWENDGKGGFKPVIQHSGSLGYKSATGLSCCLATDLNHDGRSDLCLLAAQGGFAYHFNRGFRCFGEEGDLRLAAPEGSGEALTGPVGCAAADFNGDGSLDLAVAFGSGQVYCFYNDSYSRPMLRVGLSKGAVGPVTVSVWQNRSFPLCWGAASVNGRQPTAYLPLGGATDVTVKWSSPGKPDRTRKLRMSETRPDEGIEVLLEP